MAQHDERVRLFKALSSETRLRIAELLRDRTLCVGALSVRLGVTPGAVSQHLRVLRDAGLVVAEKRGYYVHYRLDKTAAARLRRSLETFLKVPRKKGVRRCVKRKVAVKNRKI